MSAPHPQTAPPTKGCIEALYSAIRRGDLAAIAACYDEDGFFEDIAFRRRGKDKIMEMWRFVCHAKPEVSFDPGAIVENDQSGSGVWRAKYMYGKTARKPGRPVDNTSTSAFVLRGGLIVEHRDRCDANAWARQAFPSRLRVWAGSTEPMRRGMAALKLWWFSNVSAP
jgi:ketosteroid isomerase-like protein